MNLFPHFPFVQQHESMDCGPACLAMIASYHGKKYSLSYLRKISHIDREGVSLSGITNAAEQIGMRTLPVKIPFFKSLEKPGLADAMLPLIVHWNQNQFVVVYKMNSKYVWIADPSAGKLKLLLAEFMKSWIQDNDKGIAMLLEPSPQFYQENAEFNVYDTYSDGTQEEKDTLWKFLRRYFKPHTTLFFQLVMGLVVGACFQMALPFVTQSIVDVAIKGKDISFLYLILFGQLALFIGFTVVNFIRNWIVLHIGARINIALTSDFLSKLMNLPLSYFDAKNEGDLMQRVKDHERIQYFLTTNSLSIVFSIFNFAIFGFVLTIYHINIFLIFLCSSIFYALWVWLFLKKRKEVDYKMFQIASTNHNNLTELIRGMAEIKLQNSQDKRKWIWTSIQARLFKVQMQSLSLTQYQDSGGVMINRMKDVIITFFTAKLVIEGQLTLGAMLAIQYIIGQLNAPMDQFISFIRTAQDAKLSWDRVSEVHYATPEESKQIEYLDYIPSGDIRINNLSHRYTELHDYVLSDINLTIPNGKITAIVGESGSGKTTLMKLIQGFYKPSKGEILVGQTPLERIRPNVWRANCGAVAQDGFIFSSTIAQNVAESDVLIDSKKLQIALETANIHEFVNDLPLREQTKIGANGNGISMGQKQRLLTARAVYKNPLFLFFDEATNSLDAHNEKIIVENLERFFSGRTVLIIAHRLSTVRNADQIAVLNAGRIVEIGTHDELIQLRGNYFDLIRNQLELGVG